MTARKSTYDIEAAVRNQLDESWSVDSQTNIWKVQAAHTPVSARIEARQDGSFIVTSYRHCEWGDQGEVSCLASYVEVHSEDDAVEEIVERCWSLENQFDATESLGVDVASVETVGNALAETEAVFAAIPEDYLARGLFEVIYHVPAGGDDAGVADALREFDAVEIGGKPYPIRLSSVLAAETHLYRRVPLYAGDSSYGPEEITTEDGAQHVRDFVKNDKKPTPLPSESVTADKLVGELVDAGVAAIAVEAKLSHEDVLTLAVWIPDATVYETVGSYETISVEDAVLDLHCEFRCVGGPNFFQRIPVYASDNIIGLKPVSIDEGVSNIEEYIEAGCPRSVVNTPWGEKR